MGRKSNSALRREAGGPHSGADLSELYRAIDKQGHQKQGPPTKAGGQGPTAPQGGQALDLERLQEELRQQTRRQGVIVFYHEKRRYGFISTGGDDIFFHANDCCGTPCKGAKVSYSISHNERKGKDIAVAVEIE